MSFVDKAKKHNFWILCGVLTVVGLGGWIWTYMDMNARFTADKSKIEQATSTIAAVRGVANHPNKSTEEQMEARIEALKRSVKVAWQEQYDAQSAVFVWPAYFPEDMRAGLRQLRPIEQKVPFPTTPEQEVIRDWRVIYSDYIAEALPRLAETIGAKWKVDPSATSLGGGEGYSGGGYSPYAGAGAAGMTGEGGSLLLEEERPVVEWDAANQQEIYNMRFNWSNRPDAAPNTLQMLYAQEDFWTLQAIMDIIKRTNGDADAFYEATVKEIQFIRIGAAAVRGDARITPVAGGAAAGPGSGEGGMYGDAEMSPGGGDPYSTEGSMPGGSIDGEMMPGGAAGGMYGSGTGPAPDTIDPATRRYVDNAYQPLTAEELRASLTTTDPEKAYLAVAKRMPVRMRVRMDQRHLNRLLVECANASLTLEVRQVRVNPGTSGAASYGGGGGSSYPGGSQPGGGFGGFGAGGGGESMSGGYGEGSGAAGPEAGGSFDAIVELYGIIYIYNPVAEGPLDVSEPGTDGETPAPAAETLTSVSLN